jgi:hypothetical protein
MSARSFLRNAFVALAIAACGHAKKPERDPADVQKLAKRMVDNAPPSARQCKAEEVTGGMALTHLSLLRLGRVKYPADPEHSDWINPGEIDAPAVRLLLDPEADEVVQRQAAAMLLAAPFLVVYRVDLVASPLALGVKEPRTGFVYVRAIRYTTTGRPECAFTMAVHNKPQVTDEAIEKAATVGSGVPADVIKMMQDDLRAQYIDYALPIPRTSAGENKYPVGPDQRAKEYGRQM